ncbi:hypothetical protein BDV10DRAFT_173642 [Aspergillus recurvatus]
MITIRSLVQLPLRRDAIDWTCLVCSIKLAIASFQLEATTSLACVVALSQAPPSDR